MPPNVVSEASLSTRASQWWASIPAITGGTLILCVAIYIVDLLIGYDNFQQVCFSTDSVIGNFQVYRAITAVLFHASLLHVLFNMLALVPIGSSLERIMGSVRYLHVILLLAVSNAVIHILIAYIVAYNPIYVHKSVLMECQIGFSGILFAMIVIEGSLYTGQNRSIFGLFNVPAKWYPWVLLIIFQMIMPRVSLLGHLSGILSGFAYSYGLFNVLMLSQATYTKIESSSLLASCMRRPGFIVGGGSANATLPTFSTSSSNTLNFGDTWSRLRSSLTPQRDVPIDERFPGTGRTLGGVSRLQQQTTPPATANATDLEARLLEDDDLELVEAPPVSTGGHGRPSPPGIRPSTPARGGSNAPPQSAVQGQQVDKAASLRSLVAMGFEQSRASEALSASNGDITTAVEILSSSQAHH
ncbi:hypothetical protein SELMODRAFT_147697 [Selaginella moellendorffii]|uniref:UBA domain-containing protein n=1 Tax=Selaginella moellendorffii TaxID=88036 RepID=D8RJR1_SELML|nr:rhomboid-like protein 15 isoform X1 [Selaginella moellendorffii]EFJ27952.1 hypothetical protein SELMODRAFT_147697 [Selaginella moellendorffii]|eukprot:XP_002971354.1 rhomboid-like protein 15 isoform X1 [Selaginella moellendorffii]